MRAYKSIAKYQAGVCNMAVINIILVDKNYSGKCSLAATAVIASAATIAATSTKA